PISKELFHLEKSLLTLWTKMRTFDVVIFGASGYTGEHIAVEWARVYGSTTRWALAGRSKKKLEATRAMILDKVRDVHDIPIVLADALDELALTAMCQSTTLVINCTGPFRLFGEPVVRCCVAAGTHYVDISGEPQFIETMMLRYNEDARKNACVVVSACGFDSVPSDLGTLFTAQQFPKGGACSSIEAFISTDGKRAHATTYECIVLGLAAADELKTLRGNVAPFYAKGYTNIQSAGTASPDWQVVTTVHGPEPGYIATSRMVTRCAKVLLDGHVVPRGVLTTASAFGGTPLISELQQAGITFTVDSCGPVQPESF
ncbi:hypothetical protein DYB25_014280, partial [Aphanomyces astaci]